MPKDNYLCEIGVSTHTRRFGEEAKRKLQAASGLRGIDQLSLATWIFRGGNTDRVDIYSDTASHCSDLVKLTRTVIISDDRRSLSKEEELREERIKDNSG
jgi:hypothetical protein